MIRIITLLFFCTFVSQAQSVSVTPEGIKNANETDKNYVVINVEGKSASQLYNDAIKYITKNYQNPDKVIKGKIENEYIKLETHVVDLILIKNSFAKVPITADYTIELNFKENKVKYEVVSLLMYDKSGRYQLKFKGEGALSGYYIYNNKEELKKPEAKTDLENYFNFRIRELSENLQKSNDSSNW